MELGHRFGVHNLKISNAQKSPNIEHLDSRGTVSTTNPSSQPTVEVEVSQGQNPNVPPADDGKAAWMALAGSFFLEGLVWGE